MFTLEQIKELVELVGRYRLNGLEIERAGFKLRISGEVAAPSASPALLVATPSTAPAPEGVAAPPSPATPSETAPAAPPAPAGPSAGLHVVTSPIVGTFYAAPSPESPVYVRGGDRVRKGQVLCIVEAMKLMNEIECDVDGVVAEIYPKNAQPVEYGEPLFGIRPD